MSNLTAFIKRHIYIVVIILVLIIIVCISLFTKTDNQSTSTTTNQNQTAQQSSPNNTIDEILIDENDGSPSYVTKIDNYDKTVKNLSTAENDAILYNLNYTLKLNGNTDKISDAKIREGSYSQTLIDPHKYIYHTTFIVDIPSINQSYVVDDKYSPLPMETSGLIDYTTLVLCPDKSQLIYGDFNCKDRLTVEEYGQ